jgi:hypothetical protein
MATPALASPAPASVTAPTAAPARLAHLANVRSLVMFLVVGTHSAVTYSGFGRWYHVEGKPGELGPLTQLLFGLQLSFMQAWFMGILFFLAAFFAARSLARRGAGAFVRERLFRLGAPLLLYALVMEPLVAWWFGEGGRWHRELSLPRFWAGYVAGGWVFGGTGPLWFAEALLFFTLPYVAFRALRPRKVAGPGAGPEVPMPRTRTLLLLVALIGAAAFAIRLVMPIGGAIGNLQLPFFASYVGLFVLGVHAGETGWLTRIPEVQGLRWFHVALWGGVLAWIALMILGSGGRPGPVPIDGGLHWQALVYAFWEAFVAVGMSIGLAAFARRRLAADDRLTRWLADTSFGVYFFHPPVLIGISVLLAPLSWPMLAKHALVWPLAYLASLAVAEVARRVPGLNAIVR